MIRFKYFYHIDCRQNEILYHSTQKNKYPHVVILKGLRIGVFDPEMDHLYPSKFIHLESIYMKCIFEILRPAFDFLDTTIDAYRKIRFHTDDEKILRETKEVLFGHPKIHRIRKDCRFNFQ